MQHVLLIGAGTMGKEHASAYHLMKNVKLEGIVDLNKEQAEKIRLSEETRIFQSLEDAVQNLDRIDIIDICVPTFLHKQYVLKAAELRIDIICEKPLAYNLDDAKEMIEYCQKKNVKLFVGHVVRFFPQYIKARELVKKGLIGEVGVVRTKRGGSFPEGWEDWYADLDKSGGVLLDLMIHDFDFLRWTFGEVERVYSKGLAGCDVGRLDYALVTLRFKSGVIAHVEGTWAHRIFSTQFELAGKEGIIDYDSLKEEPILLDVRINKKEKGGVAVPQNPLQKSPYFVELEHFLHCLRDGVTPIVTADDAYKAMEISHAALQSLKTGIPVTLGSRGGILE